MLTLYSSATSLRSYIIEMLSTLIATDVVQLFVHMVLKITTIGHAHVQDVLIDAHMHLLLIC